MHEFCIQAHFSEIELPISDYVTDLKSVLDQSMRIIQAMIVGGFEAQLLACIFCKWSCRYSSK
ncbi:unnamed protein product [Prunus brigantina]